MERTTILIVATVAGFGTADFVGRTALRQFQPWGGCAGGGLFGARGSCTDPSRRGGARGSRGRSI